MVGQQKKLQEELRGLQSELDELKPRVAELEREREQVMNEIAMGEVALLEHSSLEQALISQKTQMQEQLEQLEKGVEEKKEGQEGINGELKQQQERV